MPSRYPSVALVSLLIMGIAQGDHLPSEPAVNSARLPDITPISVARQDPTAPGILTVEALGLDGRRLAPDHPWHRLFRLVAVEDREGWPVDLPPGSVEARRQDSKLRQWGLDTLKLSPGDYTLVFEQWLGGPVEPGSSDPGYLNRLRLPVEVPPGGRRDVVVAAGGLMLDSRTAPAHYTCRLRLEGRDAEHWRTVLPAAFRDEGIRRCMPLGQHMPLLPGRYRLLDEDWGEVLGPPFTIEPGMLTVVEVGR